MQKPVQQFLSECGRAKLFVENDMPIGIFHDFLMQLKGLMVERMVQAHKEQIAENEASKILDAPQDCEASPCETNCAEEAKGE